MSSSMSASLLQVIRLNPFLPRAFFQPNVPYPISIVPSSPSRSRTLNVTAAPALAMSQAFREILTAYLGAVFLRFVAMSVSAQTQSEPLSVSDRPKAAHLSQVLQFPGAPNLVKVARRPHIYPM